MLAHHGSYSSRHVHAETTLVDGLTVQDSSSCCRKRLTLPGVQRR